MKYFTVTIPSELLPKNLRPLPMTGYSFGEDKCFTYPNILRFRRLNLTKKRTIIKSIKFMIANRNQIVKCIMNIANLNGQHVT